MPRRSNGVRRGLAHVVRLAMRELERPLTGAFQRLRGDDLNEIARAIEWIEWHRLHDSRRRQKDLAPRALRRNLRHPKPTAPQEALPV